MPGTLEVLPAPSLQGCPSECILHLAQDQEAFPGSSQLEAAPGAPAQGAGHTPELGHRHRGDEPGPGTPNAGAPLAWKNGNLMELGSESELDLCTNNPG